MRHSALAARGFSLIELSIVLIVLALLGAGALSALRVQTERSRLLETRSLLAEAREALLNHAAVYGQLPCPDSSGNGEPDACRNSGASAGALPWHLLGVPARDAWGRVLRYSVHRNFASGGTISLGSLGGIEPVAREADAREVSLANPESVAMALWSVGADGSDASSSEARIIASGPDVDDQVTWLSRFVLLGRLLEAGHVLAE